MIAALGAVRARLAAREGDDGFTLIYTLLVISLVTVLVGSALVVATANVVPAVRSAYTQAAQAAALSGIDDFRARADRLCRDADSTVERCRSLVPLSGSGTLVTAGNYTAAYRWSATPGSTWFRVRSTGTAGGGTLTASRTLVADVQGGGSTRLTDYNVVVNYETQAPDVVAARFPARTISLDASARDAAGVSAGSVTWNGAPAGATAGSVNVCNAFYGGPDGRAHNLPPGASTPYVDWAETGTAGASGLTDRQPCQVSLGHSTTLAAADPAGGAGGYASHDALLLSNSVPGGTGPLLDQPVTTGYRYDPATATACDPPDQDYRSFDLECAGYPVEVGGAPAPGSSYPPRYDATLPSVPTSVCAASGSPCTTPAVPASGACVYTGPTRVYLEPDGTATITSPQTTAPATGSPAGCYPASLAGGIWQYRTPVLSSIAGFTGVLAVRNAGTAPSPPAAAHSATGWNLTGQKSTSVPSPGDTVFYRSFDPAAGPDPASAGAGGYSGAGDPQSWSVDDATTDCGAVTRQRPWDEQTFQCDWFGRTGDSSFLPPAAPADGYTSFQQQLAGDLAGTAALTVPGHPGNTVSATVDGTTTGKAVDCSTQAFTPARATSDQLVCLIQHDLHTANTGQQDANWPDPAQTGDQHQYVVTGYDQSTSTRTAPVGPAPSSGVSDPLFAGTTTGTASTETVTTTTTAYDVGAQVYGCYVYGLVGGLLGTPTGTMDAGGSSCTGLVPTGKWGWGDGYYPGRAAPQFRFSIVRRAYSDFVPGTSASAYFPSMLDVTQYAVGPGATGPGDLYVEGTASATIALVAQNDVIVTGSLTPASTSTAVEAVAQDDVRVYHPVRCAATDATAIDATTAGFCPNDITGMYAGLPAPGERPDQQYVDLRTDLADVTVAAAVFALGGAPATTGCPQWDGGGVCGGQFGVDNYDRGAGLGTLTVRGTLVMQHHGPAGREWEIPDATGQSGRPHSGYQLHLPYQDLRASLSASAPVAGVVATVATSAATWHVVSLSTGAP